VQQKTLAEHGFSPEEEARLLGAGIDLAGLLKTLWAVGQYAPQIVALIQQILAAAKTPAAALLVALFAAGVVSAGPTENARAALALTALPGGCGCVAGEPCPCGPSCRCHPAAREESPDTARYAAAYRQAVAAGRPLLVFVRRPAFEYVGTEICRVESFPGVTDVLGGVVVARPTPDGKALWRVADLPHDADGADVLRALNPPARAAAPPPAFRGGPPFGAGCAS
jgi:hypothetical protein